MTPQIDVNKLTMELARLKNKLVRQTAAMESNTQMIAAIEKMIADEHKKVAK